MTISTYAKIKQGFRQYCIDSETPDYEQYIDSIKQTLQLPGQEHIVYMVCDHLTYQILYASDCQAVFGFRANTPNETGQFFALLDAEHADYAHFGDTWHISLYEQVPLTQKTNSHAVHCGMKFTRPDGKPGRLLAVSNFIEPDANQNPRIVLVIMQDVSHLYKGDHYWLRASFGGPGNRVFYWLSDQQQTVEGDILSAREKQVLHLLHQGLSSKNIGLQLGISAETAQQHRRNMLARTGARDTTALLQLARWCSLV